MRTQLHRRNRTACSILALATALAVGPSPAAAQSFLGTGSPLVAGSATITTPNGTTTNVAVNNPQTVITWSPSDTATSTSPIVFQPGGTTTNFVMGGNYAVLNKIIATDQTRQIQFFGTVNSNIGSTTGPVGGSIYFYAPGGFLLGGGSVFNVGSLVLSASPILHDALAYIDCTIQDVHDAGDHVIVVGKVLELGVLSEEGPLLFYRGGYGKLDGERHAVTRFGGRVVVVSVAAARHALCGRDWGS